MNSQFTCCLYSTKLYIFSPIWLQKDSSHNNCITPLEQCRILFPYSTHFIIPQNNIGKPKSAGMVNDLPGKKQVKLVMSCTSISMKPRLITTGGKPLSPNMVQKQNTPQGILSERQNAGTCILNISFMKNDYWTESIIFQCM